MGIFDEYISGLEAQDEIDPLKVASDLHAIYTNDVDTRDAKIEQLNGSIAERDTTIADLNNEIKTQKAKNFDLAMQIPAPNENNANQSDNDDKPTTISSLFRKN